MEGRAHLRRKARDDAIAKVDEEVAKIVLGKRGESVDSAASQKRVKRAASEDRTTSGVSKAKKVAKPAPKAKAATPSVEGSRHSAETKEVAKKKTTAVKSKAVKSKTDDDIVPKGRKKAEPKQRRSQSAEPAPVSKRMPPKKVEPIAEESEGALKKPRGKKAGPSSKDLKSNEKTATNGRSRKKKSPEPLKNDTDDAPPAKKAKAKKVAIKQSSTEAETDKSHGNGHSKTEDSEEEGEKVEDKAPIKNDAKSQPEDESTQSENEDESVNPKQKGVKKVLPAGNGKAKKENVLFSEEEEAEEDIEDILPVKEDTKAQPEDESTQSEIEEENEKPKRKEVKKVAISSNGRSRKKDPSSAAISAAPAVKKGKSVKAPKDLNLSEASSDEGEKAQLKAGSSGEGKKLLNNATTDYSAIDFAIKEKFNFKISTWNVAGIRAVAGKNPDYFKHEDADVICLNEVKCGKDDIPKEFNFDGYHTYWNIEKGAGGVALISKVKPIEVTFDLEGTDFADEKRVISAEYEKFYLVSVYVVNSGRGLKTIDKRLAFNEAFNEHVQSLDKKKPVIIAGDMNVAHQEIDLANPKTNKKNAGFTPEERDGFTELLELGFVDSYRHFNPDKTGAYTFWAYMSKGRPKNVGWRLDYFVVSKRFMKHVKDNVIRSDILGSDHCPIVLFLNL